MMPGQLIWFQTSSLSARHAPKDRGHFPDLLQLVRSRHFRLVRDFESMNPQPHGPWHDRMDNAYEEQQRRTKREKYTTPTMRMYLAKEPIKLEAILTPIGTRNWRRPAVTRCALKSRV